jgi:hypothetical protein
MTSGELEVMKSLYIQSQSTPFSQPSKEMERKHCSKQRRIFEKPKKKKNERKA